MCRHDIHFFVNVTNVRHNVARVRMALAFNTLPDVVRLFKKLLMPWPQTLAGSYHKDLNMKGVQIPHLLDHCTCGR